LNDGTRHGDIKAVLWKGHSFGAPFSELDDARQPFLPGQSSRFAEQIAADVEADDVIGPTRVTGQPAVQDTRATARFKDGLARSQLGLLDEAAHHTQVSRGAPPGFETPDHAQVGTAQGNRTPALPEPGDKRLPLRRSHAQG